MGTSSGAYELNHDVDTFGFDSVFS